MLDEWMKTLGWVSFMAKVEVFLICLIVVMALGLLFMPGGQ